MTAQQNKRNNNNNTEGERGKGRLTLSVWNTHGLFLLLTQMHCQGTVGHRPAHTAASRRAAPGGDYSGGTRHEAAVFAGQEVNVQTQKELNLVEDLNLELPQSAVDPTKKVFKHFKQSRQNSGGPLVNQTAGRNKSFQSLVLVLTELQYG